MVLASNEWLHNCEDGEKAATINNTITTATTNTTAATTTSTAATTTTTNNSTTSVTESETHTISATTTSAASTTNTFNTVSNISALPTSTASNNTTTTTTATEATTANSTETEINNANENVLQFLLQQPDLDINSARILKAMARKANESKSNQIDLRATENENNNWSTLNESYLNDTLNKEYGLNQNQNTNSNSNSNTNTLQANAGRPTKSVVDLTTNKVSNPITAEALSNALQSVMNTSTSSNSSSSSANSQNYSTRNLNLSFCETSKSLPSTNVSVNASTNGKSTNSSSSISGTNLSSIGSTNTSGTSIGGTDSFSSDNNGQAKIVLICETNSHPFQTRTIILTPNIECKVGRLIAKSKASETNAIFDCKVLSRNHAVLWYSGEDSKFWVKDTKSSNGTFINDSKLGTDAAELHFGDIVKFGVDVLENSRKEVHGCIIACVKLYLPDGREAISIDPNSHRSQHSGETRISYEELHRLNLYIQEAVQREKVLKSKLYNIQNVLDATRKSSALCWQSLIAEDQLLHRIHSLEKKLQMTDKNCSESVLKNEVLKLLDDKTSYQHTAKEALRKVYQERCDAMQMLTKMESAFQSSENECKLLREQVVNVKQALQEVNLRLLNLEAEYGEYKVESERLLQEAKFEEEVRIAELSEKLTYTEKQCEELRRKICDLIQGEDEDQLQKQAIAKLDAAIADMDLGDDDDEDDDDDDEISFNEIEKNIDVFVPKFDKEFSEIVSKEQSGTNTELNPVQIAQADFSTSDDVESKIVEKPIEAKESTIMKWLQNSDLNKKEGSLDIFKAICNESDSSDEHEVSPAPDTIGTVNRTNDFEEKNLNFASKLKNVQDNLKQLEAEIEKDTNTVTGIATSYDNNSIAEEESDDENEDQYAVQANGKINKQKFKQNKGYALLKTSVTMLREAYNEICDKIVTDDEQQRKSPTPPPAISVQTQFQNYAQHKPSNSAAKRLETQDTLKPLPEINEDEEDTDGDAYGEVDIDNSVDADEASHTPLSQRSVSSILTIKGSDIALLAQRQHDDEIISYQLKINDLNEKISRIESDTQNTLEIMQFECETLQEKIENLSKLNKKLSSEKETLEQALHASELSLKSNVTNADIVVDNNKVQDSTIEINAESLEQQSDTQIGAKCVTENHEKVEHVDKFVSLIDESTVVNASSRAVDILGTQLDKEIEDEIVAINSSDMRHEEELIMYKEHLEQIEQNNAELRQEIAELKRKTNANSQMLLRKLLPFGAILIALIAVWIIAYF